MAASSPAAPPVDQSQTLRRTVASAIERLRAMKLAPGEPSVVRDVACAALCSLSTTLFTDSDQAGAQRRSVGPLVENEIALIAAMLGIGQNAEHTPVRATARPW